MTVSLLELWENAASPVWNQATEESITEFDKGLRWLSCLHFALFIAHDTFSPSVTTNWTFAAITLKIFAFSTSWDIGGHVLPVISKQRNGLNVVWQPFYETHIQTTILRFDK
jgi:hypothetical protein